MKFKKITALFVLCMFMLTTLAAGAFAGPKVEVKVNDKGNVQLTMEFNDMKEAKWALKHITKMTAEGAIKGYKDGTFKPNKTVTRAEAVVMTMNKVKKEGLITVNDNVYFKDDAVIPGWAKDQVHLAVYNGFIDVPANGKFEANKPATREWVAKLIASAYNLEVTNEQNVNDFADANKIAPEYIKYVQAALDNGVVTGFPDKKFQPNKPVTRAQMAVMLQNVTEELPDLMILGNKLKGTVVDKSVTGTVYITLKLNKTGETVQLPVATDAGNIAAKVFIENELKTLNDVLIGAKAEVILSNNEVVFIETEKVEVKEEKEEKKDKEDKEAKVEDKDKSTTKKDDKNKTKKNENETEIETEE